MGCENSGDCSVFMNLRRLRFTQRCNNFLKVNSEDVASHSYYVTLLALIIAEELNANGEDLDVGLVMKKALLHDIDESITSDIPYNVKAGFKNLENYFGNKISFDEALSNIAGDYFVGDSTSLRFQEYYYLGRDCKKGLEGEVVDIADILELAIYCYEEVKMGNSFMEPLFKKAVDIIYNTNFFKEGRSKFLECILCFINHDQKACSEVDCVFL